MKFKNFLFRVFFVLISSQLFFNVPKTNAAEEIKIIYSIFSRTIKVNSLKTYAEDGNSTRKLKRTREQIRRTSVASAKRREAISNLI